MAESHNSHRITVTGLNPVAIWSHKVPNSNCGICNQKLVEICIKCSNKKLEREHYENFIELCRISKGKCGHAFHMHCIDSWVKNCNSCPECQIPWVYDMIDINSRVKKTLTR